MQPPPLQLRDRNVLSDGWTQAQFVGYDEDFVPVVDAFTHEPSVVPFYKASFAWLMQQRRPRRLPARRGTARLHSIRCVSVDLYSTHAFQGRS